MGYTTCYSCSNCYYTGLDYHFANSCMMCEVPETRLCLMCISNVSTHNVVYYNNTNDYCCICDECLLNDDYDEITYVDSKKYELYAKACIEYKKNFDYNRIITSKNKKIMEYVEKTEQVQEQIKRAKRKMEEMM